MGKSKIFTMNEDRSLYPEHDENGKPIIDLTSHKFLKLWQGPQHPGITGNMSLELTVNGDEIVESKTHVGYLHRAFEKLLERRLFVQCMPTSIRLCVAEPDPNEYLISTAVEELGGIEIPDNAKWLRMLSLEMARLQVLLRGVPGQAGTFALGLGYQWGNYLRDLILDRFEELTGGRVYHMYIIPGGVRGNLPEGFKERMLENLKLIDEFIVKIDKLIFQNVVFESRAKGLGHIPKEWVDEYGVYGPAARGSGVMRDVRKTNPYLHYDKLDFEPHVETEGDVYARSVVRYEDLKMTVDLIRQILDKIPGGDIKAQTPNVLHWKIPQGETYAKCESSRGEYGMYFVTDGSDKPRRAHLKGPSYTHANALLDRLLINANIADTAAIMVSLATCPPEIER
ncbi:MAG: NADH-quinone oxidoreductase subunit D [Bacteroidota bacterium]